VIALLVQQLFGCYERRGNWRDGILTRVLRQIQLLEESQVSGAVVHWIVLDGLVDGGLVETLTSLITGPGLVLPNGDLISLPSELLVSITVH